jgi:PmbA protein
MKTSIATQDAPGEELDTETLSEVVDAALAEAQRRGAAAAEAAASLGQGLSVSVRKGEVETVEHNRDRGLVVTVYFGERTGSASTSDYSAGSVKDTVQAACAIASHTEEDPCNGLADPDRLAVDFPDLGLFHPWRPAVADVLDAALACEAAALEFDERITNSEGATVSSHEGHEVYGNSHGFRGRTSKTRHGTSCSVIGQADAGMQRDYWYSSARNRAALEAPEVIGQRAAERTVRRLNSRQLKTCKVPVLYEAPIASSLLSHFIGAISGGALYRQASFLLDHLGKKIFPDTVQLREEPKLPGAIGSANFDNEGVATNARDIVRDGVLTSYVLDSYAARRLQTETTGNAGGVHNLTIDSGNRNLEQLIRSMDRGVLVTELIGFGVNQVTGDYSRGAAGFWVENGEIQYPVEEITVAGNLKQMFAQVAEIGNDVDERGNIRCGSILIDDLTIAGA